MSDDSPVRLLDDEQIRRFICDGMLILHSCQAPELQRTIRDKLEWVHKNDKDSEGNILPRVPELQTVLDGPVIRGALQSILGDDFLLHPHRIMVPSEPLPPDQRAIALRGDEDGPPMAKGSISYSHWHKDTYIPLGQARYHFPFRLFLFYFPQDTPIAMGPTRVIPGSQYQDTISVEDHAFGIVPEGIQAGSCMLAAFDIDHAGMSNRADQTRFMVKFNFMRTTMPKQPSWNGGLDVWQPPNEINGRYSHPQLWSTVWDWMCARPRKPLIPSEDVAVYMSRLNSSDQRQRLDAIYTLGAMGEKALSPLLNSLLKLDGQGRIEPPYSQNEDGSYQQNTSQLLQRRWTEGGYTFQDEAFALGCLGELAVDPLRQLLNSEDPWIAINAAFALGQIGRPAARAVDDLATLLESSDHRVVRAVLEAIACIGTNVSAALPAIKRLLQTDREHWQQDIRLPFRVGDQIHFNAVFALLASDVPIVAMEQLLLEILALPATKNYVQALALETLLRHQSTEGLRGALGFLKTRRWDETEIMVSHG